MKRGTPKHPKVYDLCEKLKISRPEAIGYLELLWHFSAEFAPQGDVGRYSDKRIEAALDWSGRQGKLVKSLVASGFLDIDATFRLLVHDWADHADESTRKKLHRSNLSFLQPTGKVTGQSPDTVQTESTTVADNVSLTRARCLALPDPMPEPEPNRTPSVRTVLRANGSALRIPPEYEGFDFAAWFEVVWLRHPKPGNKQIAQQYASERIFRAEGFLPDKFDEVHRDWCECSDWQREGGKYAPTLDKFVYDEWWKRDPPAVSAPRSKAEQFRDAI